MRIDAIPIGVNPPHDVNVIIEVPVGGEPIKYEENLCQSEWRHASWAHALKPEI